MDNFLFPKSIKMLFKFNLFDEIVQPLFIGSNQNRYVSGDISGNECTSIFLEISVENNIFSTDHFETFISLANHMNGKSYEYENALMSITVINKIYIHIFIICNNIAGEMSKILKFIAAFILLSSWWGYSSSFRYINYVHCCLEIQIILISQQNRRYHFIKERE